MSWYGNYNESSKQLDALIDSKPSLANLLVYPDFIQQLKAFTPKLLEYISNSQAISMEMVTYLSVPPSEADSSDRKYKLPLLTMEMVETETTCVINGMLKQSAEGTNFFLHMFDLLRKADLLPLLAGYFHRTCLTMCRTRYKEILESVYSSPQYLELLVAHSHSQEIANCLSLFLCIESSKNVVLSEDKTAVKMGVVRSILNKISIQRNTSTERSLSMAQNLCYVLREIIEKYYLIAHGKQMLEIILEDKNVHIVLAMISEQNQHSLPAMYLTLSFLKYYSLSSFNAEQANEEVARKNIERLEAQPFVQMMCSSFSGLLDNVRRSKSLSLYSYALLEVLCHCITLSSYKVLQALKQSQFFSTLIDLLFKYENCNILHKLVERTFLHIFTTEKAIYERYKEHLFCEISIIDLTAKRFLDLFPEAEALEKAKQKGYFGILMKIIKIYSSISTTNAQIREAITSKSEVWNKMTKKIIKPYETGCSREIGQMENIPENAPIEFTVKRSENEFIPRLIQNAEAIQQIREEEEAMQKTFEMSEVKKDNQTLAETKIEDDSFFKSPLEDLAKKKSSADENPINNPITAKIEEQQDTRKNNFSDFLNKRKVQVGEEIKLQRNISGDKRLSADKKTRLTSPSPSKKRNSWKEDTGDQENKQAKTPAPSPSPAPAPRQTNLPKIPTPHSLHPHSLSQKQSSSTSNLSKSAVNEQVKKQEKIVLSLSMANLESLKKTTIIRMVDQPIEKKYRKARSKDKALLMYLGIGI